jgi:hypothetical protein
VCGSGIINGLANEIFVKVERACPTPHVLDKFFYPNLTNEMCQLFLFVPAILFVASKIHPELLILLWVIADMQTVRYFNLVRDEDDIKSEYFI